MDEDSFAWDEAKAVQTQEVLCRLLGCVFA
jgi:hypothetical protein